MILVLLSTPTCPFIPKYQSLPYVQMDELWGYVHTRDPKLSDTDPGEWGSVYIWLAIDSESKLLITHHLGGRNVSTTNTYYIKTVSEQVTDAMARLERALPDSLTV